MGGMSGGVPRREDFFSKKSYEHRLKIYKEACAAFDKPSASQKPAKTPAPAKKQEAITGNSLATSKALKKPVLRFKKK